jgi:hypothetical protein
MAFKLAKNEEAQFEKLKSDVSEAYGKVEETVNNYIEEEAKLREPIDDELALYNQALAELRSFVNDVASNRRDEFDEKSDAWKEGDSGSAADEWISTWENADLEEVTLTYPDQLQLDFENQADTDLPIEP